MPETKTLLAEAINWRNLRIDGSRVIKDAENKEPAREGDAEEKYLRYYKAILYGFNIFKMDPKYPDGNRPNQQLFKNPSSRSKDDFVYEPSINKDIPKMLEYRHLSSLSATTSYSILNSAKHFSKFYEAKMSIGGSGNIKGVDLSFKASGSITRKINKEQKQKDVYRYAFAEGIRGEFQLNSKLEFSESATKDLQSLLEKSSPSIKDCINFYQDYGTHFASHLNIGFRASSEEKSSSETIKKMEENGWDINIERGASVPKIVKVNVENSFKTNTKESEVFQNKTGKVTWEFIGISNETIPESYTKAKSTYESATPVSYKFHPVYYLLDAIDSNEFPNAPRLKQKFIEALTQYEKDVSLEGYGNSYYTPLNLEAHWFSITPHKFNDRYLGAITHHNNDNDIRMEAVSYDRSCYLAFEKVKVQGYTDVYRIKAPHVKTDNNEVTYIHLEYDSNLRYRKLINSTRGDGLRQLWQVKRASSQFPSAYTFTSLSNGRRWDLFDGHHSNGAKVEAHPTSGSQLHQAWKLLIKED